MLYLLRKGTILAIRLNKRGPNLSHLFFVDDLILFAEANLEQIRVMQACLNLFCSVLGEKVNKEKTHIYCSRNVHPNVAYKLSRESGFSLVSNLGKYLGIPLHHSRVNRASYQFLEDKLRNSLNNWKSKFLSLAG